MRIVHWIFKVWLVFWGCAYVCGWQLNTIFGRIYFANETPMVILIVVVVAAFNDMEYPIWNESLNYSMDFNLKSNNENKRIHLDRVCVRGSFKLDYVLMHHIHVHGVYEHCDTHNSTLSHKYNILKFNIHITYLSNQFWLSAFQKIYHISAIPWYLWTKINATKVWHLVLHLCTHHYIEIFQFQ